MRGRRLLQMRLMEYDQNKIRYLKDRLGLVSTSEVIRFALTYTFNYAKSQDNQN